MRVLLTNDDAIDAPGLQALYERLSAAAEVIVVAPASDQSGVGRARSGIGDDRVETVSVADHEWGYVVDGTPADCVAVGLRRIPEADGIDLVVSGANNGPNVGSYMLGHSGTVGAVVEGAFLGTPGLAVSGYDDASYFPDGDGFGPVADATATLIDCVVDADLFAGSVNYLNVNAPISQPNSARLTRPVADYDTATNDDGERTQFESTYWARTEHGGKWVPSLDEYDGVYPAWSDRAAVINGELSITPLSVPQTPVAAPQAFVDALRNTAEWMLVGE